MKIQLTLALLSLSVLVHAQGVPDHYNVTDILVPGSSGGQFHQTEVEQITNSGKVVGTRYLNGSPQAFSWTQSTGYQVVPVPVGYSSMSGHSINESGVVVGRINSSAGGFAFKYDPVNGITIYPTMTSNPILANHINEINDQGDMMFWYDDWTAHSDLFKRSKLVRADGSSVTYGDYEQMDLPTPSRHQHGFNNRWTCQLLLGINTALITSEAV